MVIKTYNAKINMVSDNKWLNNILFLNPESFGLSNIPSMFFK